MKKAFLFLLTVILVSCNNNSTSTNSATQKSSEPIGIQRAGYMDLPSGEFKKLIGQENTVLLDVRTPEETKEGVIEGAIEIDYRADNFNTRVGALDKSKTYLVYCMSGGRSSSACEVMSEMGFTDLYNLTGGYSDWPE